jgi:putative ABC transport system permease protein
VRENLYQVPFILDWVLRFFLGENDYLSISGDLNELFAYMKNKQGKTKAYLWIWFQVFKSIPGFISDSLYWRMSMFKNYLKVAFRNILRQRAYSLINIVGLALGIAICIVILLYVMTELNFDKYHKDKDRLFRVSQLEKSKNHTSIDPNTAPPLAPALAKDFPEVEAAARILPTASRLIEYKEKRFYEPGFSYIDQDLFKILSIPFIKGDPHNCLLRPQTVVISERIAEKYFGTESPLGKTILINSTEFEITGVAANPPVHTHFHYNLLAALKFKTELRHMKNWLWHVVYSYIKLKPGVDINRFEKKMSKIGDRYAKEKFNKMGYSYTFFLQSVPSLHLFPCPQAEMEPPGDPTQLYIFAAIGLLVLLIGCMNFVNLTTARSAKRAKEIGLRKVIGAQRQQLIRQFLYESMLLSGLAVILALILVYSFIPNINRLTGMEISASDLLKYHIPFMLIGLYLVVGIVSGVYPALFLSRFKSVRVLKEYHKARGGALFRKVLVVGQFSITIFLIIGAMVVNIQLDYMKNHHLGFNKQQKLIIPVRGRTDLSKNFEAIKSEYLNYHGISQASVSSNVPGEPVSMLFTKLLSQHDTKKQSMDYMFCDQDFLDQFQIPLLAGRDFQETDKNGAFIINEAAVKAFGWSSAQEALNQNMYSGTGRKGPIIGVVKNFNYEGLQKKITPLVMDMFPRQFSKINLTVNTTDITESIAFIKKKWQELFPANPFEYFFLDEYFGRQYVAEEKASHMITLFTFLGIFIASLGLFGLASFMTEQRTKEIGVRKVLGASVKSIIVLLTKEFSKWVIIANAAAWPLAYFVVERWLQNFAYRAQVGVWIFLLSGSLALFIALFTVSFKSIKAALANPVNALRYE